MVASGLGAGPTGGGARPGAMAAASAARRESKRGGRGPKQRLGEVKGISEGVVARGYDKAMAVVGARLRVTTAGAEERRGHCSGIEHTNCDVPVPSRSR